MNKTLTKNNFIITTILSVILIVLVSIYIYKLSSRSIYIWDESIYANNALEMSVTKNIGSYTNDYKVSYFNVKPPFVIILQALSFSVFGYSEFALRIPTLLFCLGVIFLLLYYSKLLFSNLSAGLYASIFFMTWLGSMRPHVFLSGDLDAALVFFTTLLFLNHLEVILKNQASNKNYYIYTIGFLLGYFSKSTAIFLILPSLLVTSFYKNLLLKIITDRRFYISLSVILCSIAGYYLYKYNTDSHYIKLVWETEYVRFVKNIMPWHAQPFNYYFYNFIHYFSPFHSILLFVLLIIGFLKRVLRLTHFYLFSSSLLYLLFISIPIVKLEWYDAPVYPLLSLLLGLLLEKTLSTVPLILRMCVNIFIFTMLFISYKNTFNKFYNIIQSQEIEGNFLKIYDDRFKNLKVLKVIENNKEEHYNVLKFYLKRNDIEHGSTITIIKEIKDVSVFDTVLCCDKIRLDSIKIIHKTILLKKNNDCELLKILK